MSSCNHVSRLSSISVYASCKSRLVPGNSKSFILRWTTSVNLALTSVPRSLAVPSIYSNNNTVSASRSFWLTTYVLKYEGPSDEVRDLFFRTFYILRKLKLYERCNISVYEGPKLNDCHILLLHDRNLYHAERAKIACSMSLLLCWYVVLFSGYLTTLFQYQVFGVEWVMRHI
jgi:hypothetical protein